MMAQLNFRLQAISFLQFLHCMVFLTGYLNIKPCIMKNVKIPLNKREKILK